jgi:ABC-type dipeptide/oligopeptide/nickel transport system permease subunit
MLSNAVTNGFYYIDPMYMVIPGLAIFIAVMASTFSVTGCATRSIRELANRTSLPVKGDV